MQTFIDKYLIKNEKINKDYGSYSLKHKAEKYLKRYVPMDELIDSMIDNGFKHIKTNNICTNGTEKYKTNYRFGFKLKEKFPINTTIGY